MRVTLKAYDHKLVDASAQKIIDTAKKSGAVVSGPVQYTFRRIYSDPYKCTLDTFIPYYSSNKSSL